MNADSALLISLFLAGLAGSLHCVGMCGPILLGLAQALGGGKPGVQWGFLQYHAGRLWTYGMLGLLVGWAGAELRHGAGELGWQRPLAVFASACVIAYSSAALGLIPGLRLTLSAPAACLPGTQRPWLATLLEEPRPGARLLLGAIMGLLPCGLVYAALLVAANLPNPLTSALGMLCFGLGTLPTLTMVVLGGRLLPLRLRAGGSRLAAGLLLAVGLFMMARSLWMPIASHDHLMGSPPTTPPETHHYPTGYLPNSAPSLPSEPEHSAPSTGASIDGTPTRRPADPGR